jgi:hypothetical protein
MTSIWPSALRFIAGRHLRRRQRERHWSDVREHTLQHRPPPRRTPRAAGSNDSHKSGITLAESAGDGDVSTMARRAVAQRKPGARTHPRPWRGCTAHAKNAPLAQRTTNCIIAIHMTCGQLEGTPHAVSDSGSSGGRGCDMHGDSGRAATRGEWGGGRNDFNDLLSQCG